MYLWRHDSLKPLGCRAASTGKTAPRNAGLTMVELLVAVSVAMVLMLGLYYIYAASTRNFKVQDETMRAMDQARFGLEQVRRDIAAAGFLATPNSAADPMVCPKPGNVLRGIAFERAGTVPNAGYNKFIQPNGVILFGAFWGSDVFKTKSVAGNLVTLQTAADGAPYPATQQEFERIFASGRLLRIVNAEQFEGYYRIQSASFGTAEITLDDAVAVATPPNFCGVQGFGVGLDANVVGYVRYRLVADSDDPTGTKVDLLREELAATDATLQTVVANTSLRIAEYVVDLQFYDFVVDTELTGRAPSMQVFARIPDVLDSGSQKLGVSVDAQPQDLRFVTVKITTRTENEDENLNFRARQALFTPIEMFEVDPTMIGAAKTVSIATRVGIKSFAVRNVK